MKNFLSQAQKLNALNAIVKEYKEAYDADPIHSDIEDLCWEIGIYGENHPDIVKKVEEFNLTLSRNHPEYIEALAEIERIKNEDGKS